MIADVILAEFSGFLLIFPIAIGPALNSRWHCADSARNLEPMQSALMESSLPFPVRQGKVRDVYDLGENLLIVATDRISAFDCVMPNGIPEKGKILTEISLFWF